MCISKLDEISIYEMQPTKKHLVVTEETIEQEPGYRIDLKLMDRKEIAEFISLTPYEVFVKNLKTSLNKRPKPTEVCKQIEAFNGTEGRSFKVYKHTFDKKAKK